MLLLIMLPVGPVVGKPGLPGSSQAGLAVLADLLTTAGVLVVRGHITHPGVQPHRVPMNPQMIKLGAQHRGFGDLQQVREFDFSRCGNSAFKCPKNVSIHA